MARTAPAPNIPPIPGMCPSIAVMGGGGGGGGGSGDGSGDGDGSGGPGGDGNGDGASGDGRNGGSGCGDPVCPVTGRVFLEVYDFGFSAPLPLKWHRTYSSRTSDTPGELGFGWSHEYGWTIREGRSFLDILDGKARRQRLDVKPVPGRAILTNLAWDVAVLGNSYRIALPEGRVLRFARVDTDRHVLVEVKDRNGNTIQIQRDARGVLKGLVDAAGRPYRVNTDAAGRIESVAIATDPSASAFTEVIRYTYDDDGNLANAVDAESFESRYGYLGHLLTEHRSPSGLTYFYRYDGATRDAYCVETWGEFPGRIDPALDQPPPPAPASGPDRRPVKGIHHNRFTYDKAARYTEVENALGGLERYYGDAAGRVVKFVDAAGGVQTKVFDPDSGALVDEVKPSGVKLRTTFDEEGNATGFVDAEGRGAVVTNLGGGIFQRTDSRDGAVTREQFDTRGNRVFAEHADGSSESFSVDDRGLLTRFVDRRGATTLYTHDAAGNLVEVRNPDGSVERAEFDYWGRRIRHFDRFGRRTEWAWDRRHQPVLKRHPDGTEIRVTWDANRKPLMVDDSGRITRYEYGGVGWRCKITDADGRETICKHDYVGNVVRVINARGQEHVQKWDAASRPVSVRTFEGIDWKYGHGPGGLRWVQSPIGRRTFERNARGQITKAEAQTGETWEVAYSAIGLCTSAKNRMADIERSYDLDRRLVGERQGDHHNEIAWNADLPERVTSDVGVPLAFLRDQTGDPTLIEAGSLPIRVGLADGKDRLTVLGDDLLLRQRISEADQLELQVLCKVRQNVPLEEHGRDLRSPEVLSWTRFGYDARHDLRQVERSDGTVTSYETTAAGQIAARRVFKNGTLVTDERIAYDAAGSPQLASRYDAEGRPVALAVDGVETEIVYDAGGRMVERRSPAGSIRYEWNPVDELIRVVHPDHVVEMDYDTEGRRIRKRVYRDRELAKAISYVWAGHTLLHEVDDLRKTTRTYIREEGSWAILGHVDKQGDVETPYLYLQDAAGAIDAVVDASGKTVFATERTVYGVTTPSKDDIGITARFVNQFWDEDVGLVYNDQRWYDPALGVYVTIDPKLIDGTINPRDYVVNPTRWVDPLGLRARGHGHPARPSQPAGGPDDYDFDYLTQPGFNATNGTPERPGYVPWDDNPTSRSFGSADNPNSARAIIDNAGDTYGCHSCGRSRDDVEAEDGAFNHWVPDHQPPISLMNAATGGGTPPSGMRLYPQCPRCSSRQGGLLAAATNSGDINNHSARTTAQMARQSANSARSPRPRSGAIAGPW